MKNKIVTAAVLLAIVICGSVAWAAGVACTKTDWGYTCTGGTTVGPVIQDTWVTSTAYVVGQAVAKNGYRYKCAIAHTSGQFATDLTAGKWVKTGDAIVWVTNANFLPYNTSSIAKLTASSANWSALNMTPNQANVNFPITPTATKGQAFWNLLVAHTNTGDVTNLYVDQDNFSSPNNI